MHDARDSPEEFVDWLKQVATESAPRLVDALGDPRESGKLHVVTDSDVIGDGGATSEDVVVSYGDRAADDDTPGKETVVTTSLSWPLLKVLSSCRVAAEIRLI